MIQRPVSNRIHALVVLTVTALTSLSLAQDAAPSAAELRKLALEVIQPLPEAMPGAENDTKALVKLGKKLYFEKKLSKNNSISCNSCHRVDKRLGGVDNLPVSPGAYGKTGDRNAPTVLNAGFHLAQFWDGRAADLKAQAKGPVLNPIEMAMPDETSVVERLKDSRSYRRGFKKAFPKDDDPVTYDNMAAAIAAFERTLITRDRFDDFLQGKDQALNVVEQKGLQLFLTLGCTTCHNGPAVGGNSYQKVGLVNNYENTEDVGRAAVTKDDEDKFKFKVPSLRNIAITGPYFHDGKIKTLEAAVEKMAWLQLGLELPTEQKQALVAFLTSMTDKKRD